MFIFCLSSTLGVLCGRNIFLQKEQCRYCACFEENIIVNIDHKCVRCLVMMFLLFYERRCDYGSLSTYACLTGDTLKGHIQYIMLVISSSQGKFYAKKQIIVFLFSS